MNVGSEAGILFGEPYSFALLSKAAETGYAKRLDSEGKPEHLDLNVKLGQYALDCLVLYDKVFLAETSRQEFEVFDYAPLAKEDLVEVVPMQEESKDFTDFRDGIGTFIGGTLLPDALEDACFLEDLINARLRHYNPPRSGKYFCGWWDQRDIAHECRR